MWYQFCKKLNSEALSFKDLFLITESITSNSHLYCIDGQYFQCICLAIAVL